MTEVQTVRDATFGLLRAAGLTTFFGNPGSTEEHFLAHFPADFRYVLALQEASAVALADGFAQATGGAALVNLHTAVGLGNAMGNLITAATNKTPLIVTAGQQTREMLLLEPWLSSPDATQLPRPWVKWSYEPSRAADVPAAFMRAIATALQPPSGPVFLSLPWDDWAKPYDEAVVLRSVSRRVAPDRERLSSFAATLAGAAAPVLIFGAAIDRADGWDEAVALAEALNAPVFAAPASERAPFPENHPLFAGALPYAIAPLAAQLAGHDVALVLGAPLFRYYPYIAGPYVPNGMRVLHISDDPGETARAPIGDSVLGDAALSLAVLTKLLASLPRAAREEPHRTQHPAVLPPRADERADPSAAMTPAQVFDALASVRPPHAILVPETPSNLVQLRSRWAIVEPQTYVSQSSGGLGWGLPAAVGIALAERSSGRNRPVVMVIGDGSLQYSVQALWTAVQQRLPLLVVVLCNGEYAILKSFAASENTPDVPGLDIPGIDVVAIATGYGCTALRVETPQALATAAAEAWTRTLPTVLEVPITSAARKLL